jgi:hypothetical protein
VDILVLTEVPVNCTKGLLAVALAVVTALLIGCGGSSPTPDTFISPVFATDALPQPTQAPVAGAVFSIREPLSAGDMQVSGTGPVGIPIAIVDITYMGEVLGVGRIGADEQFTIAVDPPLIANHRIGIMLDAQATEPQFTPELLIELDRARGDAAIAIPRVGMMYDAASVQP